MIPESVAGLPDHSPVFQPLLSSEHQYSSDLTNHSKLKRHKTSDTYCGSSGGSDLSDGGEIEDYSSPMANYNNFWAPEANNDDFTSLFQNFTEDEYIPVVESAQDPWEPTNLRYSQNQTDEAVGRTGYDGLHGSIMEPAVVHPNPESFNSFLQPCISDVTTTTAPNQPNDLLANTTTQPQSNDLLANTTAQQQSNDILVNTTTHQHWAMLNQSTRKVHATEEKTYQFSKAKPTLINRASSPERKTIGKKRVVHSPKKKVSQKRNSRQVKKRSQVAKVCTCKIPVENQNIYTSSATSQVTDPTATKEFTSRYRGVCWYKRTGKWVVQIKINGKRKHIGYFTSEQEAAKAYDEALRNLLISQQKEMEVFKKKQIKFRAPRRREFNQCPVHSDTLPKCS